MQLVLFSFLLLSFVFGQIMSVSFPLGVRVSVLDVAVIFNILFFIKNRALRQVLKRYVKTVGPFLTVGLAALLIQKYTTGLNELIVSSLYLWRFATFAFLPWMIAFTLKVKEKSLDWLFLSGIVIAILGLLQYFLYPDLRNLYYLGWDPHLYRLFSTFLDPNFTGIILVLTVFLGAFELKTQRPARRPLLLISLVIAISALLLTYSRGSFVAFMSGSFFFLFLTKKAKWGVGILLISILLLVLLPRPGGEGVELLRSISVQARVNSYQEAIELFSKNPILGVGFNTIRFVTGNLEKSPGTETLSRAGAGMQNSWLFILVTTGIVGFLAYIWIWWQHIQARRLKNKITENTKLTLVLVSVFTVMIDSLFDNSLFYPQVMVWFWILVGNITPQNR